jgi:hypothetical protein
MGIVEDEPVPCRWNFQGEAGGWLSTWICCVKNVGKCWTSKNEESGDLLFSCFKYCNGELDDQPLGFYWVPYLWTRLYCEDEDLTRDVSWETTLAVENDLLNALSVSCSSKIDCSVWSRSS